MSNRLTWKSSHSGRLANRGEEFPPAMNDSSDKQHQQRACFVTVVACTAANLRILLSFVPVGGGGGQQRNTEVEERSNPRL